MARIYSTFTDRDSMGENELYNTQQMAAILGRVYSIQEHGPETKAKKKEQTRMYRPCQLDAVQCVVSILITGIDAIGKTKKGTEEETVQVSW